MIATVQSGNDPQKFASNLADIKLHIVVITASAGIVVAHSKEELQLTMGQQGGFSVNQTDGAVEIQWSGDLWVAAQSASPAVTFDFSIESAGNIKIGTKNVIRNASDRLLPTSASGRVVQAHYGRQRRP